MTAERLDDPAVPSDLGGPAALLSVDDERLDVDKLIAKDVLVPRVRLEVVAGLTDVRIGARTSGEMPGARAGPEAEAARSVGEASVA